MEISGKILREVEFRDRLRGYDTDEVDEFLEKVAAGVDELRAELDQLARRAERAEQRAEEASQRGAPAPTSVQPAFDDDAIRRTLVLAQRTADMAVAEARDEAAGMLEGARSEAARLLREAEESARRTREDAEHELQSRLARLAEDRERLEGEVQGLLRLLESERSRLTESLSSALRLVGEALATPEELAAHRQAVTAWPPTPGDEAVWSHPPAAEQEVAPASEPEAGGAGGPSLAEEEPAGAPWEEQRPGPRRLPDVEDEIAEDAASAHGPRQGRDPAGRGAGGVAASGTVRVLPAEEDGEEELWQRWAAGRDLGVVPGGADISSEHRFGRDPEGRPRS